MLSNRFLTFVIMSLLASAFSVAHANETEGIKFLKHYDKSFIQSNGKILFPGSFEDQSLGQLSHYFVRFNSNGGLDQTFQQAGKLKQDFAQFGEGKAFDMLPTGRFMQANMLSQMGGLNTVVLSRYLSNMHPDTTFGNLGKVVMPTSEIGCQRALPMSLKTLSNNKSLASFLCINLNELPFEAVVARFLPNGQLDQTFGNLGSVKIEDGNGCMLNVHFDGSFTCVKNKGFFNKEFHLTFHKANGALDTSVLGTGIFNSALGADAVDVTDVRKLANGKYMLSGHMRQENTDDAENPLLNSAVLKLLPNGAFDPSFGTQGILVWRNSFNMMNVPYILQDGRIISTQWQRIGALVSNQAVAYLERRTVSGVIDRTFGSRGTARAVFAGQNIMPYGFEHIEVLTDGRLMLKGQIAKYVQTPENLKLDKIVTAAAVFTAAGRPYLGFGNRGSVIFPAN